MKEDRRLRVGAGDIGCHLAAVFMCHEATRVASVCSVFECFIESLRADVPHGSGPVVQSAAAIRTSIANVLVTR